MKASNLLNELSEYITIKINGCTEIYHDRQWSENKAHKDYDLWYITAGHVNIEINGICFQANSGDVMLFCPDVQYSASNGTRECRFIYLHFDLSIGNNFRILDEFSLPAVIPAEAIETEAFVFRKSFEQYRDILPMSSIYLKGGFTMLLARILDFCCSENNPRIFPVVNDTRKNAGKLAILQPVINYISEHLGRPLRVAELSSLTGMSEKYFISYFKRILGISPGQYIHQLKMNRAREYLYQKRFSVKEISNMLGYPDPYTFSKAFKKYYKLPPSRFVQ